MERLPKKVDGSYPVSDGGQPVEAMESEQYQVLAGILEQQNDPEVIKQMIKKWTENHMLEKIIPHLTNSEIIEYIPGRYEFLCLKKIDDLHNLYERAQEKNFSQMLAELKNGTLKTPAEKIKALLANKIEIPEGEPHPGDGGITVIIPSYGDPSRDSYIPYVLGQFTQENNSTITGTINIVIGDNGMSEEAKLKWQSEAEKLGLPITFADATPYQDRYGNPKLESEGKDRERANAGTARNCAIREIMNLADQFSVDNPNKINPWQNPLVFVDDDSRFEKGSMPSLIQAIENGFHVAVPERVEMVTSLEQRDDEGLSPNKNGDLINILNHGLDPFSLIGDGSSRGVKTAALVLDFRAVQQLTGNGRLEMFVSQKNGSAEDITLKLLLPEVAKVKNTKAFDMMRVSDGGIDESETWKQRWKWGYDHVGLIISLVDGGKLPDDGKIHVRNVTQLPNGLTDWENYTLSLLEVFSKEEILEYNEIIKSSAWIMNIPQLKSVASDLLMEIEDQNPTVLDIISTNSTLSKNEDKIKSVRDHLSKLISFCEVLEEKLTDISGTTDPNIPTVPNTLDENDLRFTSTALEAGLLGQILANLEDKNKVGVYILRQSIALREEQHVENLEPFIVKDKEGNRRQVVVFTDYDGTYANQEVLEEERRKTENDSRELDMQHKRQGIETGFATARSGLEAVEIGENTESLVMGSIPHICENGAAIILPSNIKPNEDWPENLTLHPIKTFEGDTRYLISLFPDFNSRVESFISALKSAEIDVLNTQDVFTDEGEIDMQKLKAICAAMGHPTIKDAYNSIMRVSSLCLIPKNTNDVKTIREVAISHGLNAFGETVINVVPNSEDANKGKAIEFINMHSPILLSNPNIEGILPIFFGNSGENDIEGVKSAIELGGYAGLVSRPDNAGVYFSNEELEQIDGEAYFTERPYGTGLKALSSRILPQIYMRRLRRN